MSERERARAVWTEERRERSDQSDEGRRREKAPAHRASEARAIKHDTPAARQETQLLGEEELVVYEAVATVRRPMSAGDVAVTAGMDQDTVRAVLDRLVARGMLVAGEDGVTVGPNDWDVRGAQVGRAR